MLELRDPILTERPPPGGIELPPLREPESLEMPTPYVSSAPDTVMTSKELAGARSAALPPTLGFDRFGQPVGRISRPSAEVPEAIASRMVVKATKGGRTFDWIGGPGSALPKIIRQMEHDGWSVAVREEAPPDQG